MKKTEKLTLLLRLSHDWRNNMRTGADWLRYLPYFFSWFKYQQGSSNPLQDKVPWVNFEAKAWLDSVLTKEMNLFEYGSGGSTIYFAMRVKSVVSVEHEREWAKVVRTHLETHGIENFKLIVREPELETRENFDGLDGQNYASAFPGYEKKSFKQYVAVIDDFEDDSFDLVFIDGRSRSACVLHSITKVSPGGFLMLDNSERPRYTMAKNLLSHWRRTVFFGPGPYETDFWETTVWQKPVDKNGYTKK